MYSRHHAAISAVVAPPAVAAAWAVGGVAAGADAGVTPEAAALSLAVVLYVHVLTDLIWDVWCHE